MDGPLILYKAWLLSLVTVVIYRRFFETVGARSEEFEHFAAGHPLLAAVHGDTASLERVRARLTTALGSKTKVVALLGGWPWPHYVLALDVSATRSTLTLTLANV